MTSLIKVRLRRGSDEIEAEGSVSDVSALLERWWAVRGQNNASPDTDTETKPSTQKPKKRARPSGSPRGGDAANGAGATFDPMPLVNEIKESRHVDKIVGGSAYKRTAAVLFLSSEQMTSGQIHKVLDALDVKIGLPRVSTTLKENSKSFITDKQRQAGGQPAKYRLSANARAEIDEWLNKNGE